jgi:hypothetical protein
MQTARTKERRKVRAAPQVNSAEIATVEANVELCFAGAREDGWLLCVFVGWMREDGLQS